MAEDRVPFQELGTADLVLDRVYQGGSRGNVGDDAIGKLLPVGNQGGFRFRGSPAKGTLQILVLYTSGAETDWPDHIDPATGDFTYYGDNREPGRELHDTKRGGNSILRQIFAATRSGPEERRFVPPVFLFEKVEGRSVRFRGLLVPGSPRLNSDEELVAVWRTSKDLRFQNYRAHFTILRTAVVTRSWINEILAGAPLGPACPPEWRAWVKSRIYQALEAPRTTVVRGKAEQLPVAADMWILRSVHRHFSADPVQFENFAAEMWLQQDPNVSSIEVTRPSRDGGRDAIGEYRLGPAIDPVRLEFALEAKCYDPDGGGVGTKQVMRLISRIKHREFGVFVTTAHIAKQAYQEVREDAHPIVFIAGREIVDLLRRMDLAAPERLGSYLRTEFPIPSNTSAMDIAYPVATGEDMTVDPMGGVRGEADSLSAVVHPNVPGGP